LLAGLLRNLLKILLSSAENIVKSFKGFAFADSQLQGYAFVDIQLKDMLSQISGSDNYEAMAIFSRYRVN